MKLDLTPEIEAGLLAQAQARGLSLEAYLDWVLQRAAKDAFPAQAGAIQHTNELATGAKVHVQKRPATRKSLVRLFAESPFKGLDLKFERDPDTGRPVRL